YLMSTIGPLPRRGDDYGSPGSLTLNPDGTFASKTGIIEFENDADGFNFNPPTSSASFSVDNWANGGMLTPNVKIYDPVAGVFLSNVSVTNTPTRATISNSALTPGYTYRLVVTGSGQNGDLGEYTVNGTATQFVSYYAPTQTLTVSGLPGNNNITLSIKYNGGNDPGLLLVSDSVNG